jgi:hypothetical protein
MRPVSSELSELDKVQKDVLARYLRKAPRWNGQPNLTFVASLCGVSVPTLKKRLEDFGLWPYRKAKKV